jgi:hypothetical protein
VVFGAFAGAVFYVATAVNISRIKLVGLFHHFIHIRCDWCSSAGVVLLKVDWLQRQAA